MDELDVLPRINTNMKPYIFLVALALISCDTKSQAPSDPGNLVMDVGLRGLYSVSSISGLFKAPEGSSHYIITTLEFEDGKLARRGPMVSSTTESLQGGSSTAQFLWGKQDGKTRTALVAPGSVARADNDFWSSMMSTSDFGDGSGHEYKGYQILGMGQSDVRRAGIGNMGFGPDLEQALKERMFVGVLVARFFSTREEVDNFSSSDVSPPKKEAEQDVTSDGDMPSN